MVFYNQKSEFLLRYQATQDNKLLNYSPFSDHGFTKISFLFIDIFLLNTSSIIMLPDNICLPESDDQYPGGKADCYNNAYNLSGPGKVLFHPMEP